MKKLLIFLFSIFFLSSPSVFADDISDFQIEGISIGDSLLDYMTEEEILEEIELNIERFPYLNKPYKYVQVNLDTGLQTYDQLSFLVKNNSTNKYITDKNEKYTILYIRGLINYIEDFDSCIQERDEVAEIISEMFPNTQKNEWKHDYTPDPSGKSFVEAKEFVFASKNEIQLQCLHLEKTFRIKSNWLEGLSISIGTNETKIWLQDS